MGRSSRDQCETAAPPCPIRATTTLPPPVLTRGLGATSAGVPGAPNRPRLHRGSPRAHWPRRSDHSETCRLRPLLASPGRGGRDEAPPCTVQLQTEPGALPPLSCQSWGGRAVCGFPTRWREPGALEEGRGSHTPCRRVSGRGAEDTGSPVSPGCFLQLPAHSLRFNLIPSHPSLKMEKLVSRVLQFWKPACAPEALR